MDSHAHWYGQAHTETLGDGDRAEAQGSRSESGFPGPCGSEVRGPLQTATWESVGLGAVQAPGRPGLDSHTKDGLGYLTSL